MKPLILAAIFGLLPLWAYSSQPSHMDDPYILDRNQSISFNFHDVRDDVEKFGDKDPYAVNTKNLVAFFDWLHRSQWHPIRLEDIDQARLGKRPLPANAILLTFDDGTLSNYTHVFPLLKQYKIPAVFAIVTSWIDKRNPNGEIAYGTNNLMSWPQMREMQNSGLVEFASHSDSLHEGVLSNPQGNQQPAATTRQYLSHENRYETDIEYKTRILNDLQKSKARLDQELGIHVKTIIWPYGAVTPESEKIAQEAGLPFSFSLGKSGINHISDGTLKRILVTNNSTAEELKQELSNLIDYQEDLLIEQGHSISLGFDDLVGKTEDESNQKLGILLNNIQALSINRVFIDVIKDTPQGVVSFFPNRTLPVQQDLLNRFIWQSKTRLFINTYAHIPISTFKSSGQPLMPFIIDLMKNNPNISGLDFDIGETLSEIVMMDEKARQSHPLLEEIQNIQRSSEYHSNVSIDSKLLLHGKLNKQALPYLKQTLPQLITKFDYIHLDFDQPENKVEMAEYLSHLKVLPQACKNKLIIHININNLKNEEAWKNVQHILRETQRIGLQNIGIHTYTLANAARVHHYLYNPLSQNMSPLTYKNPFLEGVKP